LQATAGSDKGSWAPAGSYGKEMGRVVTTAMATLSLEVYYRYLPFAFTKGAAVPKPSDSPPVAAPQPTSSQQK
ncbi:MAG: hypothetical protein WCK89_17250, partial [bacterium]